MKTKQATADNPLKLNDVNKGTVLRIRNHDFHVLPPSNTMAWCT
jgi:hypothetical protein